jgi:type IV pilus assembly protein PilY1
LIFSDASQFKATVQEGGSLYQAQFAYEQFGEWQGTILRKTLNKDGTVVHEVDAAGNWDASEKIKDEASIADAADTRNLWSAIPGSPYVGNWDNFKTENSDDITELFELFGYNITDYHNSTSYCSTKGYVGDDGTLCV